MNKKIIVFISIYVVSTLNLYAEIHGYPEDEQIVEYKPSKNYTTKKTLMHQSNNSRLVTIDVTGEGVAPAFAHSHAQAYALAKRAALADGYRLLAERIGGLEVEGKDTIQNMAIQNSTVKLTVNKMIKNASIVETTFHNGLCEVTLELQINMDIFKKVK